MNSPHLTPSATPDLRFTQKRIRVRIDHQYHQEPVISRLVSDYHLTVNIAAALLPNQAQADGWFDLELQGTVAQLRSALIYLSELDLEIWPQSEGEEDGW
uniref:NIL domain-containing protein n=1 Tax=Cyanothece sp. (strain PCC 7425 / ATCC 29141) TaxID=395961 RepID=B8HKB6_CYAP4